MAQQKREKLPTLKSPAGIARYPKLTKPDAKFNPAGVYSVDLILSGGDAQPLIEAIDKAMQDAFAKAKADPKNKGKKIKLADAPYSSVTDDDGNETGEVKFRFKMTASGKTKEGKEWARKPAIFVVKGGQPVLVAQPETLKIGGGTVMKVAYQMAPFYTALVGAGVSLRLEQVLILKLVEWSAKSAFGDDDAAGYEDEPSEETMDRAADEEESTTAETSDEEEF